ncbi:MAG: molybdate ABC transporter substrate-binding protein [Chloroflexi bacterium]|nr:molybdate ABC transporter substrate-binding protein [Chloroflexota bacterium]|tara:strand:- start:59 stop:835 length:777 start_codon:yes stop_codon:yes gene_type:complete
MKAIYICIFIIFSIPFISCEDANNKEKVVIYAASSISDLLIEGYDIFSKNNDIQVVFNFGGSISLANQITKFDSPADGVVFIGEKPSKILSGSKKIDKKFSYSFLTNGLVFVGNKNSKPIKSLEDLLYLSNYRIIIADPKLAPLGVYSKEILSNNNMYNQLEKNIIFAKDAKAVHSSLENHNADYGIIYYSDLLISKNLVNFENIQEVSKYSVNYYIHVMQNSRNKIQVDKFFKFLTESDDIRFSEVIFSRGLNRLNK